jgi:hypothetical protein
MNMGNRKAMAEELHLHPQTVRYRLGQLRALFGSALDEPATRAALLLALGWDPAVTTATRPTGRPCSSISLSQREA